MQIQYTIILRSRTLLSKTTSILVIKRTMLTRMSNMAKRVYPQVPPINTHTVLTRPVRVIIPQQNAVIVVHNPPARQGTLVLDKIATKMPMVGLEVRAGYLALRKLAIEL